MKTFKFFFFALVAVVLAACSDNSTFNGGIEDEDLRVPEAFIPTGEGTVDIIFDDDSRVAYRHSFELSAEAERRFKGTAAAVCTGEDFQTAAEVVTFTYNVCENDVKVNGWTLEYEYKGKKYTLGLPKYISLELVCRLAVEKEETNPLFHAESVANYTLALGETQLATTATRLIVDEEYVAPDFDKVEWSYAHKAFRRSATLSNGIITVLCDNTAKFADLYTDGSKQNEEEVAYIVSNKFNFSAPAMEVDKLNDVVGKTFNFNNGTAVVEGKNVKAEWTSASVEGAVKHGDKDYASEIIPCKAAARTITFSSANQAVVKFYDDNANDFAEVTVPVTVTEKVTLKGILREFVHVAFRKNAVVSGSNIAVICDNNASFVKEYSNGKKDDAVKVSYTVTNNFSYSAPAMVVENMDQVLNKTYNFNNGTAVVAGKNVTVTFSNRVVGNIMFENKNYKNEAPKCAAEVKTITITSSTTATIVFEGEGETITAVVPVSIIEAESVNGEIKAAWATDSYNGRTFVRTDLHILAELNGAYVVYSRQNRNEAWTITNLTAAEGQSVLASGRALAWIWNGNNQYMGTVAAQESASAGHTIQYYLLDGQLANNLGKSESTLNGKKFEYPIHGTGKYSNGMWTIAYNGSQYYFVSNK